MPYSRRPSSKRCRARYGPAGEDGGTGLGGVRPDLGQQPRLPDACLAGDEKEAALPARERGEGGPDLRELRVAADEGARA